MAEETQKWEYRVQTVGAFWSGVKADELEQLLNAGRLSPLTFLKMQTRST